MELYAFPANLYVGTDMRGALHCNVIVGLLGANVHSIGVLIVLTLLLLAISPSILCITEDTVGRRCPVHLMLQGWL